MAEPRSIFLTGVTGTLGKEFVRKLLQSSEDRLYLLVRRKSRLSHWDRVRKILAAYGLDYCLGTRVQVLAGDLTLPHFGLQPDEIKMLSQKIDIFYHIAALTALNGSQEDCRKINVEGTHHALDLARDWHQHGRLQRFFYFSTAYASGSRQTYYAYEDGLPSHPAHANFYESSKYEAEGFVRKALSEGLPVTIFRPSIVVGHSQTGEVSEFNVIYPFMKLFAHGILKVLPTRIENSFNIVPIDFVIDAAAVIAEQKDSLGKTYHLVTEEPPTIGMLLRMKDEEYPDLPPVEVLPPENFKKEDLDLETQQIFQMLEPYLGYLNDNLTFDTINTQNALRGTGITFPKTDYGFLKRLVDYAIHQGYLVVPTPS